MLRVQLGSCTMSDQLKTYRRLQDGLSWVRLQNAGRNSDEEERLLELMDVAWWELSETERDLVSSEPPRGDLVSEKTVTDNWVDVDISVGSSRPPRKIARAA